MTRRGTPALSLPGFAFLGVVLAAFALGPSALGLSNPVPVWQQRFAAEGEPGTQDLFAVRELADGSILLVAIDNARITALRFDHGGQQLSAAAFSSPSDFPLVAIDPYGGIFVGAYAFPGDIWTMKYDGYTGKALWIEPVVLTAHGQGVQVVVDPAGDLIVHGYRDDLDSGLLWKLDRATGAVRWGPLLVPGPAFSMRESLAFDPAGNVVVSGLLPTEVPLSYQGATIEIDGATGATVWGPVFLPGRTQRISLGLDRSGDVFVASTEFFSGDPGAWAVLKYSGQTGAILWGPFFREVSPDALAPVPRLAVTTRGDVVVAGVFTNPASFDLVTDAYDGQTGALLWGPVIVNEADPISDPSLQPAGNGDVFESVTVYGSTASSRRVWRYAASDGSTLWGPRSHANGLARPFMLALSDGNLLLAKDGADAELVGLDSATGDTLWGPATFDGVAVGFASLAKIATAPDGNFVVTGTVSREQRLATIKYNRSTGAVIWGPVLLDVAGTVPSDLAFDPAGDILLTGTLPFVGRGGLAIKLRGSDGALLWGPAADAPLGSLAAVAPSGDLYLLSVKASSWDFSEFELTKLSGADGSRLWGPVRWNDDPTTAAFPSAIGTDANGDVFVAGEVFPVFGFPAPGGIQFGPPKGYVYKYDGSDGSRLWRSRFARSGSDLGYPRALVVGGIGNVTVTGSTPNGVNEDITTIKYDGSSGASLWGPRIVNGDGNGDDLAHAVVLDSVGNVYVGGESDGGASASDLTLVKYQWNDGALLWGPVTHAGPRDDILSTLALDAAGNLVAHGASFRAGRFRDIVTLGFSGATGSYLWGPIVLGGFGDDVPAGVSAAGTSLVVAGTSDRQFLLAGYEQTFGIQNAPEDLPIGFCGEPYASALVASNGALPYAWNVVSGNLPPGVILSAAGALTGKPEQEGTFTFRAEVSDSSSQHASRDFTVLVAGGGDSVPIEVEPGLDCQTTLSVEGDFAAYQWLPGGETTPTITVSPENPITYGVVVTESGGCLRRGAVTVTSRVTSNPDCTAPWPRRIQPSSGPPGAAVAISIEGENFAPGLSASIGGSPAAGVAVAGPTGFSAETPSLLPGTMNDLVVTNPGGKNGTLLKAFFADFSDVPGTHSFHASIERIFRYGVTAGCGTAVYCPDAFVTRDQMAIFILRAKYGPTYAPPAATGTIFDDVPADAFGAAWIEQFFAEGISKGCGPRAFCPSAAVTRDQMAVFLLRGEHGAAYLPPDPTGAFSDVSPASPFARWIEQLSREQITSGCGPVVYCPGAVITRGPMAKFLARTFRLP